MIGTLISLLVALASFGDREGTALHLSASKYDAVSAQTSALLSSSWQGRVTNDGHTIFLSEMTLGWRSWPLPFTGRGEITGSGRAIVGSSIRQFSVSGEFDLVTTDVRLFFRLRSPGAWSTTKPGGLGEDSRGPEIGESAELGSVGMLSGEYRGWVSAPTRSGQGWGQDPRKGKYKGGGKRASTGTLWLQRLGCVLEASQVMLAHGQQEKMRPPEPQHWACDDDSLQPPEISTAEGLRLATATPNSACSRACSAMRAVRMADAGVAAFRNGTRLTIGTHALPGALDTEEKREQTIVLLIAHWTADVTWARLQPYCYIVSEKERNGAPTTSFGGIANKGNEAASYLSFIVEHWEHLPHYLIAMHDERVSKHSADAIPLLSNLNLDYVDKVGYASLNSIFLSELDPDDFPMMRNGCFVQVAGARWLGNFSPRNAQEFSTFCCAQFATTKRQIQARPHAMYRYMLQYLHESVDSGHDHHFSHRHTRPIRLLRLQWLPTAVFTGYADGSFERGECLELLWGVIFGDGWQGQRRNATQLCGSTAICPQHAVNCDIQGASEPSCCKTEQASAGYVRCELCRPPDGHGQYFCEQSNAATQLAP